jgi:hypothetical protein
MHANTHTTMALPTRRNRSDHRAPSRPDTCQAACRPESRRQPACEPGGTLPRPACGRLCDFDQPNNPDQRAPQPDQEAKPDQSDRQPKTDQPATSPRTSALASATASKPWSPGSNRSRTPITAGPSTLTDDRPTEPKRRPSPRPRPEDEWSPGRMRPTVKPSWSDRFASRVRGESGMSTAEYAVGTLAAVAFAGVLLKVLTSGPVQTALSDLIERALS